MKPIHLCSIGLMVLLVSCSDKLDLVDPVDPIPVVYFELKPEQRVQYLTLTHTYSGDSNAYNLARNTENVFYDSAHIVLEEWIGSYKVGEDLFSLTSRTKEPGIFPEESGYCFTFKDGLYAFLDITHFRLVINVPGLDKPIFSRIAKLSDVVVVSKFNHQIDLYPDAYDFGFSVGEDVKYSDLICVFRYQEFAGEWINHSVTFVLRKDIQYGKDGTNYLYPDLFFNKVAANIKPINDTIIRKFVSLDLILYAGDQYFRDYQDTYINSGNQYMPPKGNITNGLGLFTMVRSGI